MRRYLPLFLALLSCVPCLAQEDELKRIDIFAGYQYAHLFPSENGQGWNMAATANLNRALGFTGDISGSYERGSALYTYLVGPTVSVRTKWVRPFAHALVGVAHVNQSARSIFSNSATSFADAIGGGIDYRLIPLVAWRVQADFLQTRFFSATQDNFRFSTGLVLRF